MTRNAACPGSMELTRRVFESTDRELREHLDACPACAQEAAATRALVELGRELPDGAPSDESVEVVRRSLETEVPRAISGTPGAHRRTWIPVAAAASVALAVAWFLVAHGSSEPQPQKVAAGETRRATVHAQEGAQLALLAAQPDEMVRLSNGTITVTVEKLRAGERFRVVTGDAEVEVRGTAFDVTAKDDALVGVRVLSGKVEVRPKGREIAVLGPGERWEAAREPRDENVLAVAVTVEAPSAAARVERERTAPSATVAVRRSAGGSSLEAADSSDTGNGPVASTASAEAAFNAGWNALRIGRPADAAALFAQAVDLEGGASILEDAVFWRAVALDRSGAPGPAADGMRDFLQCFPSSVRRGEVSVMLGWKLLQSGDPAGAKALFDSALGDPVPWVRTSAARGVSETGRQSPSTP